MPGRPRRGMSFPGEDDSHAATFMPVTEKMGLGQGLLGLTGLGAERNAGNMFAPMSRQAFGLDESDASATSSHDRRPGAAGAAGPRKPASQEGRPPSEKKGGMKELFNSEIVSAQPFHRPLEVPVAGFLGKFLPGTNGMHTGMKVETADGGEWLVHKNPTYGSEDNRTVVTPFKGISKNWKSSGDKMDATGKNLTVNDFNKASGPGYKLGGELPVFRDRTDQIGGPDAPRKHGKICRSCA